MLGWQEVVLIFAILLFVVGPTKLPKIARELGKVMREFNKATSGVEEKINKVSSGLTEAVRPHPKVSTPPLRTPDLTPPLRTADRRKRDKALSDIAKKLNVTTEGKTNEQITKGIIEKIEDKKEKASDTKAVKR